MKLSEMIDQAREALDSMDDFARMDAAVDAIGPRGVLERFINEAADLARRVEGAATATAGWHGGPALDVHFDGCPENISGCTWNLWNAIQYGDGRRVALVPLEGE